MPLKQKRNKWTKLKNHDWREADQLAIYKHGGGVELGSAKKQLQLHVVGRAGLELGTSGFQIRRPNLSAMLPAWWQKPARWYTFGISTLQFLLATATEPAGEGNQPSFATLSISLAFPFNDKV